MRRRNYFLRYNMKVFKTFFAVACLSVLMVVAAFTAGCRHSPQELYHIGTEYNFGGDLIKVEDDKQNEQFVYSYKKINSDRYDHFFYFIFMFTDTLEYLLNSDEFEYSDSTGAEVVFDDNGHYLFNGSREIYISYAGANERIKQAIANDDYDLEFGVGMFIHNPYSDI